MRGTLDFDPDAKDYGPASPQIRAVIREYAEVDWFEPGGDLPRAADAFRDHETLAGFPHADLRLTDGTRDDFLDLCAIVRSNLSWDWKMSVLKPLVDEHCKARGWRVEDQQPGDLFLRLGDSMFWTFPLPKLELTFGNWFHGYANADMLDAIQWWLAEPSATANPFVPLVRCYRLGVYPFSLSREKVVLFAFKFTGQRLPMARVVR